MKLKSVQRYDCSKISICFGFVGASFQGKDGDGEDEDADEDAELCETEEEEPKPKEPKKTRAQRIPEVC